ncbi:DNA repair protein RadC [Pseudomonas gingeri NCPPB 3146 = LMG 5327]|uniref:DNA repair protein RadC n=2 Tax=Pseudomonas gingeri TaxID=117681 RepID=A0A7Y8CBW8_9PSED|nr:DNA repair protein RadC [Pseudomonas gingeri]NWA02798.1 DNA repair protein RadC [Pseudomonas gingeri]NWA18241.1 DNA repair protein RadC [Pseudomonas gingeri]NWA58969.1 DNA repair protein RadC [Pseudomonas gingeri]NWA99548.1 DNA repair protein RadC [Pseudomonas gingeri]NWB05553.1 DNA repair protein RadC [Pseudomonas gingeri]
MGISITVADGVAPEAMSCAEEDRVIERAMQILDRRLFTREGSLLNPLQVGSYLKMKLAAVDHEVFAVVFLDNKHQILKFEVLFHGCINDVRVHPRQIIKRALAHNASALIVAHNHPSGCALPSEDDRRLTRHLKNALELMEMRLLDHIIVAAGSPLSMAERGML